MSEETICEPPSTLHEMLTAVAVTLILAGQAFGVLEVRRGAGCGPPGHWVEPPASVSVGGKPGAVCKSGLLFVLQRLSASLL